MKQNVQYSVMAILLIIAACSKESPKSSSTVYSHSTYFASFETLDTKTYIDDALKMRWLSSDMISIFSNTYNQCYSFDGADGDLRGSFSMVPSDTFVAANPLDVDYTFALYPYREENAILEDGTIIIDLPSQQPYKKNTMASGYNPMIARTKGKEETSLEFKNLCGYLVVPVTGTCKLSSIIFSGSKYEMIAGAFNVTFDEEMPSMSPKNSSSSLTIECNPYVQLDSDNPTEFWFVLPPTVFLDGFALQFFSEDNVLVSRVSTNKTRLLERNTIYRMDVVDIPERDWMEFLNPLTGEPAIITLNEGWWGETHLAKMKYIDADGFRSCIIYSTEDGGIWGDAVDATLRFRWYTKNTNNNGYQFLEVPKQYFGFDYSDWASKPISEAIQPIFVYDYPWYWVELGFNWGSNGMGDNWLDVANKTGQIDGSYPVGYYDGNGGFFFNLRYYIPGTGGFTPDPYDFVAIADGFNR